MKIRLQAKPQNVSIIQFYAPTNAACEEEIEEFYNVLQEEIDNIPCRDMKIVMEDANSKVGKSNITTENYGRCGLGECNERGESLIDFCKTNNLSILNALFSHHPRRLYTWTSPDGKTKNQSDFIMISQKWKSSVKNTKTLPGADCNSNHQLLVADIKIRLKKLQKNYAPMRLDFSTIDNEYRVQLDNRFMSLLACEEDKLPSVLWEEGKRIILETAKATVMKRKNSRKSWISAETLVEIENRRQIKSKVNKIIDGTNVYKQQNSLVQRFLRKDKERHINDICQRIESSAITNQTKDLYQGVKKLTRKFRPRIDVIKNENKEVLSEGSKVMDRWKRYCEKLYNKNRTIETSHITAILNLNKSYYQHFQKLKKLLRR